MRTALERNPTLRSTKEAVKAQAGRVTNADGAFDWNVDLNVGNAHVQSEAIGSVSGNTTNLGLGISKRFGWGMVVNPRVEFARSSGDQLVVDPLTGNIVQVDAKQSSASLVFGVVQPILRGVGGAATAELDGASFLLEAAKQDYLHGLTTQIVRVGQAYWTYAGAVRNLEIFRGSEARAKKILDEITVLVKADERPASDLEQLEASYAERMRDRIAGEQQVTETKFALAVEMGLDWNTMDVGPPATELPKIDLAALKGVPERPAMLERARKTRRDLIAAQGRIQAAQTFLDGADNGRLPQLDLLADIGWTGFEHADRFGSFFGAIHNNVGGVNFTISLRLLWPLLNDGAAGATATARASYQQAVFAREAVLQQIGAGVSSALAGVTTGAAALDRATAASQRYQKSVDNERRKLQAGLSTIIDVTFTEDQLNSALLGETTQHIAYARAVLRLRFETASLAVIEGDEGRVDVERLTKPPGVR